ncbi:hypothetical protein ACJJTC_014946 [Scirpophaga incertulas]
MKRRNQQSDISSFFKKAAISEPEPGTSHSASSSDFIAESPSTASGKAIDLEHDSDSDSNKCDIYNYVHNLDPQLDNVSKLNMLENIWKPPNNFNFPLHEHGGHKRRFQASWMSTYEWLSYSKSLEGGFCKYCVLFKRTDSKIGKGNHQIPGSAIDVKKEWTKWLQPFTIYLKATKKHGEPEDVKIVILLHQLGSRGIEIYNTFEKTKEKVETFNGVIEKLINTSNQK